jgi:hypothetical protein
MTSLSRNAITDEKDRHDAVVVAFFAGTSFDDHGKRFLLHPIGPAPYFDTVVEKPYSSI